MNDSAPRPMDADAARGIARAFLPERALGNRYDYYYTLAKLRTDPLYPGVLDALCGHEAPLLDLGCGLGLLAHALRRDGRRMPYLGVDIDAPKIARARRIAERAGLAGVRFDVVDLAAGYPPHRGSVAILDVLQFLTRAQQAALLDAAIAMLAPGAVLVMRAALDDGGRRIRRTRAGDRFAALTGWMPDRPRHYPTVDELRARFDAAGLEADIRPWFGNTPFNNWLVVARPGPAAG
ncbi:MAG: methyltransferase domain-containing protein [Xanthomonadaceae bacterium]|jgi:SAM-dependent methyltransferase|uniref:Methyltransferase domain-containing protein n=2 Tax=Luteimonas wenzhouensis TaxID=2599615 RepID=A0A5C5TYL6_9GAMM|nr:methyltransferase domain-containing protein [Luteimonas wenzhouensis]NLW95362.1 methyltransferase domain-containing protein [Xanthomonadaceae bacterium]TWT18826.1 methyltransferase domain-containing protein [Luteimonas wenzhouensis]